MLQLFNRPSPHFYISFFLQELSNSEKRIKINEEKLSQAQTALVKVHSFLKDEETKRGSTNILTGVTSDYHHLYTGDLLTQVLSNLLKEDEAKISHMKLRNHEVSLAYLYHCTYHRR
jgi:hypothetical protein